MQAVSRPARLYQAAWLVQLAALELHHADLAVQDKSCKLLLAAYFTAQDTGDQETGDLA